MDDTWRIIDFKEKPEDPPGMPRDPDHCLVSMGNYVFTREPLEALLLEDAADPDSTHDFGNDIIPRAIGERRVFCYDFTRNQGPGQDGPNTYWRDVGTIESYFDASMDLRMPLPEFNLYNDLWPIRTPRFDAPPAKFVHHEENRKGRAIDSLVGEGSIISGALVKNSIIGRKVKIHSFCEVTDSIIFDNVEIGRGSRIHRAIIDKNNRLPPDTVIGHDDATPAGDHFVSETGIVVVPKRPRFESKIGMLHF